jgi:hypothetical protein
MGTGGPQTLGSAGQGTGGTSGTLLYQLQPGDPRIGGQATTPTNPIALGGTQIGGRQLAQG